MNIISLLLKVVLMGKIKLDKIDRKILADLQEDGRMTNVQLAERAGISAPPCLRRVRALEEANVILGYHAEINPNALGYSITIFAQVGLDNQGDKDLKEFEKLIHSWDLVRECYMVAGDSDFLLKIVAEDWDDYQDFLTNQLTSAPNVKHVKSSMGVKMSKYTPGIPVELS